MSSLRSVFGAMVIGLVLANGAAAQEVTYGDESYYASDAYYSDSYYSQDAYSGLGYADVNYANLASTNGSAYDQYAASSIYTNQSYANGAYTAGRSEDLLSSVLPGVVGAAAGGLLGYRFGGAMGAAIGGVGGFLVGQLFKSNSNATPWAASSTAAASTGALDPYGFASAVDPYVGDDSTVSVDPAVYTTSAATTTSATTTGLTTGEPVFVPAGTMTAAEAQEAVDMAYTAYVDALKAGGTGETERANYLTAKAMLDAVLAGQ